MHPKILSIESLAASVQALKASGKSVVLCHGVFDLLHPGHIRHFQSARALGDVLIVTVTPDQHVNKGPGRPVFPEQLRLESLAALSMIDYVALNRWPTAIEAIELLRPDVYAKGEEYEQSDNDLTGKIVDEEQAVHRVGGRIQFTHDVVYSSTKLLNTHFGLWSDEVRATLDAFKKKYSASQVIDLLKGLKGKRVLVVGDSIIDEYHTCQVIGRASKTTAINARFLDAETYAGGALAVANHVAGFCDHVHLVSCLGERDSHLSFIEKNLRPNISRKFFTVPDRPTILKRRFIDSFKFQKLFEESFIDDRPLPSSLQCQLDASIQELLPEYDLVIVADFGHGMIHKSTVKVLTDSPAYLALNAQTNSPNMGYNPVTKYPRADYVCVDQEEIRLAYHDRFGALEDIIARAESDMSADIVAVTRANRGSTVSAHGVIINTPVFSTDVVDTMGAGDAFLAITSPCAAAGFDPELIGFIGNAVGALAIRILGNRESIDSARLYKYITTLLK